MKPAKLVVIGLDCVPPTLVFDLWKNQLPNISRLIDRGTWGDTIIGDDVKIDNLVQVGHNARIERCAIICACAVIGGSAVIEEGAFIGLNATILPGIRVGARAVVGAGAVVTKDVPEGVTVVGVPARVMK